jgi:hypothetical protein
MMLVKTVPLAVFLKTAYIAKVNFALHAHRVRVGTAAGDSARQAV